MSEKNDSRWWEFYGIRYAQGTVVGALIVFFLFSQSTILKGILFIPADPKDFGIAHLVLLGIYGLAFCYIASAPILIMHSARGLLFPDAASPPRSKWRMLGVLLISALIAACFWFFMGASAAAASFLLSSISILQALLLFEIFKSNWDETIAYNLNIIKKRKMGENSEYVESYKHLREHGNSFLIVVFQLILAIPIFIFVSSPGISSERAIANLLIIILTWIIPASIIWFFGNKLENHLNSM